MTERELSRIAAHRLAVMRHAEEVTKNVSRTCRYYGITRQSFYKWRRRYLELGKAGLRDRSSRPHRSPRTTREEVVGKIVYLRQSYHFGPLKIAMYLQRYHHLNMSQSGIWRILRRLGLSRLPTSQRYRRYREHWKRYEKPQPGHQVQIDVKFIAPLKARARPTTSSPRSTTARACACCVCTTGWARRPRSSSSTTCSRSCRSTSCASRPTTARSSAFHWHVLDRGIDRVYIKPATPRLNGKVERSHRIDAEEFYRMLEGVVVDDAGVFNTRLQEWEDFYNYHRPHGSLAGRPRTSAHVRKSAAPASAATVSCTRCRRSV